MDVHFGEANRVCLSSTVDAGVSQKSHLYHTEAKAEASRGPFLSRAGEDEARTRRGERRPRWRGPGGRGRRGVTQEGPFAAGLARRRVEAWTAAARRFAAEPATAAHLAMPAEEPRSRGARHPPWLLARPPPSSRGGRATGPASDPRGGGEKRERAGHGREEEERGGRARLPPPRTPRPAVTSRRATAWPAAASGVDPRAPPPFRSALAHSRRLRAGGREVSSAGWREAG